MIFREICHRGNVDFAIDAMNRESPVNLHRGFSFCADSSFHAVGTKCNFRILLALQDLTVHFAVPHFAASVAALCVHDNFAGERSRARVELQRARFNRNVP